MKLRKNRLVAGVAPILLLIGLQVSLPNAAHAAAFTISSSSGSATVGTHFSGYSLTSSNPGGGTSYSIDQGGTLAAASLSFDTVHGTISGTPTSTLAATMFTITEFSVAGGTQTQTYTLTINAATTPVFSLSSSSETATVGTAIAGYTLTPLGTTATGYTISPAVSNGLSFDTTTGLLSGTPLASHIDITYTITATDASLQTAFQLYDITVIPAPLTSPAFTLSSSSESVTVGNSIVGYTINSTGDAITSFSISPSPGLGLVFNPGNGLLSGSPLNVAAGNMYTITAHDAGGNTASQNFILLVSAATPTSPAFTLSHSTETVTAGNPITGYTINSTGDFIMGYTVFPLLPPAPASLNGLSFNPFSGLITGTPTSAAAAVYTITAADALLNTASQTYTLTVNSASAPPVTYYPKQQDSIKVVYPQELQANKSTVLMVSGIFPVPLTNVTVNGVALSPDNYSVILDSTRYSITIPAQQAGSKVTLDFYDGETPLIDSWSLNVGESVTPPAPIIKITSPAAPYLLAGSVGVKFSGAIAATSTTYDGKVDPVSYSLINGALPDGLVFNSDGTITGTPTKSGTWVLDVGVSDTKNSAASGRLEFTLDISNALTITASLSGKQVAEKTVVTNIGEQLLNPIQLSTTGGVGGVSIYVDPSNVLPIGLTFDQTTNTLNGNGFPLTGIYGADEDDLSITFDATDSGATPQIATYVLTLDLIPTLQLQLFRGFHSFIPSVGDPFSYDLSEDLQGGKKPYSFQLTKGKLPKGVTLTSAGVLSGVINSPGDISITVTVTDSGSPIQTYDEDFYLLASNNDA